MRMCVCVCAADKRWKAINLFNGHEWVRELVSVKKKNEWELADVHRSLVVKHHLVLSNTFMGFHDNKFTIEGAGLRMQAGWVYSFDWQKAW